MTIEAEIAAKPAYEKAARIADKCVHITLHFPTGSDLTVQQISAEKNCGETHASVCLANAALRQIERASRAGEYDLPLARLSDGDVPIVVSAVASDRSGRRISARAIVQPHAIPQTERLAQHSH
jgi:hypothetical protein